MPSLAEKLLKTKAALGLDLDDAPASHAEPKSNPKQHRVEGGIDKSKKKVRLNARQKAKAAGKAKKARAAPVEGNRADRRMRARAAKEDNTGEDEASDENKDEDEDADEDEDGKAKSVSSSVAEELVRLAREAQKAAAAVAPSRKSKSAAAAGVPLPTTRWTVFLNQLPYTVTQRDIAGHMAEAAGISPEALVPFVRMCQRDGQFTGSAFVDVPDEAAYWRALQLHHEEISCADGRRRSVNVRASARQTEGPRVDIPACTANTPNRPTPRAAPRWQVRAALVRNKLETKRGAVEPKQLPQQVPGVAPGGSSTAAAIETAQVEAAVAHVEVTAAEVEAEAGRGKGRERTHGDAGHGGEAEAAGAEAASTNDARTLVREAVAAGHMQQGDLDERAMEYLLKAVVKAGPQVAKVCAPPALHHCTGAA